ncbi:M1 family metallopeptidase [Raineya orbicola]|uniref:Peptidase MA superfamily n=1 Tax=Raineya orbicola TaxID=2016530 RepID=A0A2N3IIF4_9BACT|nr:M1 family metallopeptidase [Raineya orbicola]PKQ70105.1 Peptidase MA superfamily [Raineya orbicola]
MNKSFLLLLIVVFIGLGAFAQPDRWQQRVQYTMEIDMDVQTNRFKGKQKLVYFNNSPDVLQKVFYHLYFNAFQPNSLMDVRSRTIADPDGRVRDRIFKLKENEIGYQKVLSLKQDGKPLQYKVEGTILEVELAKPIAPKSQTIFEMEFEAQVPIQIRRTGRDNAEGVRYSMAQWYPKMAQYDYQGWHAHPYIGREFYGIFGDFDVKISVDSSYMVAATGILQNPQEIGKGYDTKGKPVKRPNSPKLTWQFKASNVHDFVWAADPEFLHTIRKEADLPEIHFFYKNEPQIVEKWRELPNYMVRFFRIMNEKFGKYPYEQFSFIQGGDGGMEYPMATLILGRHKEMAGLVGVAVHEAAHNWFYGILGTNESLYPWMDEGFTTFAEDYIMAEIVGINKENPHIDSYRSYFALVKAGQNEPLSTHADHYRTNRAYSVSSYSIGSIFLNQLSYIIGKEAFDKGMLEYFNTWKFKHPNPNDFIRVMEQVSGLELDWYKEYWIYTTKTIDYGIKAVNKIGSETEVILERKGEMIMPIDVWVTYKDGKKEIYNIPLDLMRGEKKENINNIPLILLSDWGWTYPEYTFKIPANLDGIEKIEIDPTERMADVDRANNGYPFKNVSLKGEKRN